MAPAGRHPRTTQAAAPLRVNCLVARMRVVFVRVADRLMSAAYFLKYFEIRCCRKLVSVRQKSKRRPGRIRKGMFLVCATKLMDLSCQRDSRNACASRVFLCMRTHKACAYRVSVCFARVGCWDDCERFGLMSDQHSLLECIYAIRAQTHTCLNRTLIPGHQRSQGLRHA